VKNSRVPIVRLALLTFFALLVHGYHLGVDDAEIYIPGIKKVADPALYPFGSQFFMSHAHLSLFSNLVGSFVRLSFLPVVIFLFHIAGIFFCCWPHGSSSAHASRAGLLGGAAFLS
jgi:hypothetical protein